MRNPKISYKLIIGRVMFIQDKPIEKWGTLIFRNFHILRKNGWTMQMWWAIQVVLDQQKWPFSRPLTLQDVTNESFNITHLLRKLPCYMEMNVWFHSDEFSPWLFTNFSRPVWWCGLPLLQTVENGERSNCLLVTDYVADWWFLTILKNISQWEGLSHISYIMENKKCLKPPTR